MNEEQVKALINLIEAQGKLLRLISADVEMIRSKLTEKIKND